MAKLVRCRTCGKEIAKNAKICPHCGAKRKKPIILYAILIIFGLALIGSIFGGKTADDPKPDASKTPNTTASGTPEQTKEQTVDAYEITYQNCVVYRDSIDQICCYAIVEVKNTGTVNLYLDDATFDFEDKNGELLATYSTMISSDPDIIAPGEKGYFYCNTGILKGEIDENTEYNFVPHLKVKQSKNEIIRYEITETSITEGGMLSPATVIGRIKNNTDDDAGLVWVAVVFFREDGTPIAACGTNVTDLKAGEQTSFDADAVWLMDLNLNYFDIARYEVYACKTQYQF